jgi:hypothetical protein
VRITSALQRAAWDQCKEPGTDRCEACGNEYGNLIEVRLAGRTHKFDSFECAIHAMAISTALIVVAMILFLSGISAAGHNPPWARCCSSPRARR